MVDIEHITSGDLSFWVEGYEAKKANKVVTDNPYCPKAEYKKNTFWLWGYFYGMFCEEYSEVKNASG